MILIFIITLIASIIIIHTVQCIYVYMCVRVRVRNSFITLKRIALYVRVYAKTGNFVEVMRGVGSG